MGTSFWTTAATVTPGGGGSGFWVVVEHPTHMVSARTVTLINIGSRNSAFLIVSLLPSQRREAPSGRSGGRRFGLKSTEMEKALVATFALASAWTSSNSSPRDSGPSRLRALANFFF